MPAIPSTLPVLVDSARLRARVYSRLHRWADATDPRIVRRLWLRQPYGAKRALCPSCGAILRDGMLVTFNQIAGLYPAGPAYQALAAGDVQALTPELPIEPGELWCIICLPCLEDYRQSPDDPWLSERLQALVDEVLQGA